MKEEEEFVILSSQLLENIFNLTITATQTRASEAGKNLDLAKEEVADYLEKIVNGLRHKESPRKV